MSNLNSQNKRIPLEDIRSHLLWIPQAYSLWQRRTAEFPTFESPVFFLCELLPKIPLWLLKRWDSESTPNKPERAKHAVEGADLARSAPYFVYTIGTAIIPDGVLASGWERGRVVRGTDGGSVYMGRQSVDGPLCVPMSTPCRHMWCTYVYVPLDRVHFKSAYGLAAQKA
ncbi:hypothetical protein C8R44DRAFT_859862 [Mycena epipterygia]|nr:hypothetical protein C8R44DRAFT_859862 [Mycena epipterygia]